MTGIITPRVVRSYLTAQLDVTDDGQENLFIDGGFDFFKSFVIFLNTDVHYRAHLFRNLAVPSWTRRIPTNQ